MFVDFKSTFRNTERLFTPFLIEDSLIISIWIFAQHQAVKQTKRHGLLSLRQADRAEFVGIEFLDANRVAQASLTKFPHVSSH